MRNILTLIQRFHALLIFLVLEAFAFILIVQNNNYHKAAWINSSSDLVGVIYTQRSRFSEYLRLDKENEALAFENAILRNRLEQNAIASDTTKILVNDTLKLQRYKYMPAKVINNSVNRPSNFITLNRGKKGGVRPDMGVVVNGSIVGYVKDVSNHFAIVTSVLNPEFVGSVRMKGTGDIGQLSWETNDPEIAVLKQIPKHVRITVGDTIVTTGFSNWFPADMLVGTVDEHEERPDEVFHRITVRLSTDFRKLNYVQVISDILKAEQDSLELVNAIPQNDD